MPYTIPHAVAQRPSTSASSTPDGWYAETVSRRIVQYLIDDAFTTSLSVYQSMLSEFSPTEAKHLETLLEKVLARLDHLSGVSQPWIEQ
jgi:hypothetical protein